MFQLYLPYVKALNLDHPLLPSQASFCVGRHERPIAFSSPDKAARFVAEAQARLGMILDWGTANELEFPDLKAIAFDLDPELPHAVIITRDSLAMIPEPMLVD